MDHEHADVLRGLTVDVDNPRSATEDLCVPVELCRGARVFSYTLEAKVDSEVADVDVPAILATLKLQDSEIRMYSKGCRIRALEADLSPPPQWPAAARLCVPPGVNATLILSYGHCT